MSEFKFACPVCGQHITADSGASGSQLECPTCFRKIVVPQAPAADSKLILSAAQPAKQRPVSPAGPDLEPLRGSRRGLSLAGAVVLLILAGGVLALYSLRPQFLVLLRKGEAAFREPVPPPEPVPSAQTDPPPSPYPVPLDVQWTLDLNQSVIPDKPAAGSVHGRGFLCEQASLTGGTLSLRQGKGWPPDLAVAVLLAANKGEELGGKTFVIPPGRTPPVPQVILRWKDAQQQGQRQEISAGYALRVSFDQAATSRIAGKIYVALPDDTKSVVAGTFDAEIRTPRASSKK